MVESPTTALLPQLAAGQVDAAVVNLPVDDPDLVIEPLFAEDMYLLVTSSHPLAAPTRSPWPSWPTTRCCCRHRAPRCGPTSRPGGPRRRAPRDRWPRSTASACLTSLAFEGFGATIVPATAVPRRGWIKGDSVRIPVRGLPPPAVGLARRRRAVPSARWPERVGRRAAGRVRQMVGRARGATAGDRPGCHSGLAAMQPDREPPAASPDAGRRAAPRSTTIGGPPGGRGRHRRRRAPRGAVVGGLRDASPTAAATARAERLPLVGYIGRRAAPTSSRAWPPSTAGAGRPGPSPTAPGVVPVIFAVTGPAVSGPALLLGLADHVVMTEDAYAFVSGPDDGGRVHRRRDRRRRARRRRRPRPLQRRAPSLVVADDGTPRTPWPTCSRTSPPTTTRSRPLARPTTRPTAPRPSCARSSRPPTTGSYDVRDVMRAIVDDGELLELRARWAPNLVTAFATRRRPAGRHRRPTSRWPWPARSTSRPRQKGARFVALLRRLQPADRHPGRHARASTRARTSSGGA